MNTYSGTDLNEKINAFRLKKGLYQPNILDSTSTIKMDFKPTLLSRAVSRLEKMDRFWSQNIHPLNGWKN